MSRNLGRINCRICDSVVKIVGVSYRGESHYQAGMRLADAECSVCATKYTAWIAPAAPPPPGPRPTVGHGFDDDDAVPPYGRREVDLNCVSEHGFYDLSYRSTFNDEPGNADLPSERVEVFRVVKVGSRETWIKVE